MKDVFHWSWWRARPKLWFSYSLLVIVGWAGFIFFRVLNWTRVRGWGRFQKWRRQRNGREKRNIIMVSNHLTMFDSFIVGIIAFFPEIIFYPSVAPYNLAAKENYFRNGILRLLMWCLHALPVKSSRVDVEVMQRVVQLLPGANAHIFPGGRRSYAPLGSEPSHPVRGGIGYVLANAPTPKPLVVPVFISGVQKLFGGQPGKSDWRRWFIRPTGFFRRPLVIFGDPVEWQDIIQNLGNTKQAWEAIARRVAEAINRLDPAQVETIDR